MNIYYQLGNAGIPALVHYWPDTECLSSTQGKQQCVESQLILVLELILGALLL